MKTDSRLHAAEAGGFVTSDDVCRRYGGITRQSLGNWLRDPAIAFPRPLVVKRRRFWSVQELADWERSRRR